MNTESLKRDGLVALAAIGVMFLLTFSLNWISSRADLGETASEMRAKSVDLRETGHPGLAAAVLADIDKQPSAFSEAVSRTTSRMVGLIELGNLLAIVAVATLFAFLVMKQGFPGTLGKIGLEFDVGWKQFTPATRTKWQIIAFLVIFFAIVGGRANGKTIELAIPISDKAIETIIHYEVGGKSYYNQRLHRPTVPAWRTTRSGVTVGFGMDMGHMSKTQIKEAFTGILTSSQIRALQSVSGMKGSNAHYNGLPKVRNSVTVTWEQATEVFERNTLPRWATLTAQTYNLTPTRLHPHENGALLCMTFNRGTKLGSSSRDNPPNYYYRDRYMEKRKIKFDLARGYAGYVPGHFRSMKRLWSYSSLKGLHLRYDATARLFALGSKLRLAAR
tara:strand:+ start:2356 stop:3522 length:1167 start_codon:yes stop_codon:yes gene_type:complete